MQSAEVALSIRGAMGGLLSVAVAVVDCFAVTDAAGVRKFAVVLYFSLNLEFSLANYTIAYVITRSLPPIPHPPSNDAFSAVVAPDSYYINFNSPVSVSNFFSASVTILRAPSLVSVVMGSSATSAIV